MTSPDIHLNTVVFQDRVLAKNIVLVNFPAGNYTLRGVDGSGIGPISSVIEEGHPVFHLNTMRNDYFSALAHATNGYLDTRHLPDDHWDYWNIGRIDGLVVRPPPDVPSETSERKLIEFVGYLRDESSGEKWIAGSVLYTVWPHKFLFLEERETKLALGRGEKPSTSLA